ncbi:hypothetical protein GCM10009621_11360 [Corynebacterium felinum]
MSGSKFGKKTLLLPARVHLKFPAKVIGEKWGNVEGINVHERDMNGQEFRGEDVYGSIQDPKLLHHRAH